MLGAYIFCAGLFSILSGTLQSVILDTFGYIQPTKENHHPIQSDQTKFGIWLLACFLPSIFYIFSYLILPKGKKVKKD